MDSFIIGITGGSGSGKTTFIRQIEERLGKENICVISQDNYYRPIEEQESDELGIENFDLPNAIDNAAFYEDLKKIIGGDTIKRLEYTFNNDAITPKTITYKPAPVLIVEGIFVLYLAEIRELLNLKLYVHAKDNLKIIRRIKRDRIERDYPLNDVLYRYEYHVTPTYEQYIRPYMEDADLVINNNDNFDMALDVIAGFLNNYLNKKR